MPRKARIDAPGALHHVIVRGIERRKIFLDDTDREDFIERLSNIIDETQTACFAWALIPNHFHLLLRTGNVGVSRVMQRLLTGYAVTFNRRHHRQGHLFQNRYKSILCQEDAYLLELVRYIHLNPLRAGMVGSLNELKKFPYSGYRAFFKKGECPWQNTEYVLKQFGSSLSVARKKLREFMEKGIAQGRRDDLVGGGLIRSAGGWAAVKALQKAKIFQKNDERILGDGGFVEKVLSKAQEKLDHRYRIRSQGLTFESVLDRVRDLTSVEPQLILTKDRRNDTVRARSLACYLAAAELGLTQPEISLKLGMTQAAVSIAIRRGAKFAKELKCCL